MAYRNMTLNEMLAQALISLQNQFGHNHDVSQYDIDKAKYEAEMAKRHRDMQTLQWGPDLQGFPPDMQQQFFQQQMADALRRK